MGQFINIPQLAINPTSKGPSRQLSPPYNPHIIYCMFSIKANKDSPQKERYLKTMNDEVLTKA